jgi:hypothetical protein
MSNFKIGDRVKIIKGCNVGREGVVVRLHGCFVAVDVYKDTHITYNLAYEFNELELIKMQEKKTKTVKKYAVVWEDSVQASHGFFTKEQLSALEKQYGYEEGFYHIVPTLFIEEEVPVKTETVYNFICYNGVRYYATQGKYKDLETAKLNCAEAIQQIDSSAEEVEIE